MSRTANTLSVSSHRMAVAIAEELTANGFDARIERFAASKTQSGYQVVSESASAEELRFASQEALCYV